MQRKKKTSHVKVTDSENRRKSNECTDDKEENVFSALHTRNGALGVLFVEGMEQLYGENRTLQFPSLSHEQGHVLYSTRRRKSSETKEIYFRVSGRKRVHCGTKELRACWRLT